MKIHEMQGKLEDLGNDLLIISETAGAIETSLDSELLTANQVGWALIGIVKSLEKAVKDVDEMVKGVIGICSTFDSIYGN